MKKKFIAVAASLLIMGSMGTITCSADRWVGNNADGWRYQYDNGTYARKGWLYTSTGTYYIKADGTRQTGWMTTKKGNTYYFNTKGKMMTGWVTITTDGNKAKYYFGDDGIMTTGIMQKGNKTYYFNSDGSLYKTETRETRTEVYTVTTTITTTTTEYADGHVDIDEEDPVTETTFDVI